MLCFKLVIYFAAITVTVQQTCPAKYVMTNLHQKNCTDKATAYESYYLDKTTCIPKCTPYSSDVNNAGTECSLDPNICTSGYTCQSRCGTLSTYLDFTCEIKQDCVDQTGDERAVCRKYCAIPVMPDYSVSEMCMAYHSNMAAFVDKWWTAIKFKPLCDDDGNWAAKQCKGGLMGRCLCYSATGQRLFGQALYKKSDNMTCGSKVLHYNWKENLFMCSTFISEALRKPNLWCKRKLVCSPDTCSRRKSDLSIDRSYVSLHCDSIGNYEPLQCDVEKNICWCVEPLTGEISAPVVPSLMIEKLPCYSINDVGNQYLRQCESKKYATNLITSKLKGHGVKTIAADTLQCDADGSYGAYSISDGMWVTIIEALHLIFVCRASCTWRDNSKIGTWQTNIAGMTDKLTCNCARDTKVYGSSLTCEGSGNYVLLQQVTSEDSSTKQYFCVDEDGFAKSGLLTDPYTNCTLFY